MAETRELTKGVAVANFSSPATYQMDLVLGDRGHLGIPAANQLGVLFNVFLLDFVEDDRMNVLAAG